MARTIKFISVDGNEEEIPARYVVCERCEGSGTHTNPNIDENGLTHDMVDDPEFMQNYRNGWYDIKCTECNGKRVVLEPDEEGCDPGELDEYYNALHEMTTMYAEIEAERRFGA